MTSGPHGSCELEHLTPAEGAAWGGFLYAHSRLVKAMSEELEAAHGMTLHVYDVLWNLSQAPGGRLRMADLAERVLLTRSGLTGLVKRLEAAGLVERAPAQEDARGAFAVLTPLGIQRLRAAHRTHLASIRGRFTGQLSEAELAQLGALWRRLA